MAHTHSPGTAPLRANAADPTRTVTLRSREAATYRRRWRALRGSIRELIVDLNAFRLISTRPPDPSVLDFGASRGMQLAAFEEWFDRQLTQSIVAPVGAEAVQRGRHESSRWVREAYARGLSLARSDIRASEYELPAPDAGAAERIAAPTHQEELASAFVLTYRDLQTVASATHAEVTRELATALAGTVTARELATRLGERIKAVGETRATSVVETRVVSTVNRSILREYQTAEIPEVGIAPEGTLSSDAEKELEWETAGDLRVCPECAILQGSSFKISEIERGEAPIPPLHPRCRCRLIIL